MESNVNPTETDRGSKGWGHLPLALLALGLCVLLHPYSGIIHDSRLYTLQALNHLSPELYGSDVFLKYGSQDSYTVFTPFYAGAASLLGFEAAASVLTLASICLLMVSAWQLSRTLAAAEFSWLGLGLLAVVPTYYGSGTTFSVLEGFVTPRMPAEALALFGVAAWLRGRHKLSAALLLAATLIHPIMAFPALTLVAVLWWDFQNWRRAWPIAAGAAVLLGAAWAGTIPLERWQFDDEWWRLTENTKNLLPSRWTSHDWARIATVYATLFMGARILPRPARRLATGVLVTSSALLLGSLAGGDLLRIVLVVQGQAWRSLWLATVVALLLLPLIAACCWKAGPLQRGALLMLLGAWIAGPMDIAFLFSIPAVAAAFWGADIAESRKTSIALHAAIVLLGVIVLCTASVAWVGGNGESAPSGTRAAQWLELLRRACAGGVLPAIALFAVWHLSARMRSPVSVGAFALLLAAPTLPLANPATESWFSRTYTREVWDAFASWRKLIPPGEDVLWATRLFSSHDPASVWLLLQRPSYYSSVQSNSGLFSRPAAMELRQRGRSVPAALPTELPFELVFEGGNGTPPSCASVPAGYIITDLPIEGALTVPAPRGVTAPFNRLQLHICS